MQRLLSFFCGVSETVLQATFGSWILLNNTIYQCILDFKVRNGIAFSRGWAAGANCYDEKTFSTIWWTCFWRIILISTFNIFIYCTHIMCFNSSIFILLQFMDALWKNKQFQRKFNSVVLSAKGQLISKAKFKVLIWTKKGTKIFLDFCPSSLKWVK